MAGGVTTIGERVGLDDWVSGRMSYRFVQITVGLANNGRALASILNWLSAGGRFFPAVKLKCGCGRWKRSELNALIWLSNLPHFHDLCWKKEGQTPSFLDCMPLFSGPSLELSWIALPFDGMAWLWLCKPFWVRFYKTPILFSLHHLSNFTSSFLHISFI